MRHVATFLSCVCLILVLFPWGEVKGQDRAIAPFCDGIKQGVQDNKLVIALADPFRHSGTEEAYRTLKNVLLTSDEPQNLIYCQGGIYNSHEVYEWLQQLVARFSVNEIFLLGMGYDALLNDPRQPWRKLQDDGTLERLPWKEVDHFLVQKPLLDKVHFSLDTQAMSAWYKSVEGATLEQMDGFWKIKSDLSKYNYLYSSDEIPVEAGAQYQINVETELVKGRMRLGVLDIVQDAWIGGQDFLKPGKEKSAFSFNVPNGRIKLILHNNVNNEPAISEINIHDIAVKKIVQDAHTYSFRAEEIFAFTNANVRKIKKLADDKGITLASSSVWMPFFQLPEDAQRRGFSNNRRGHLVSIHQAKSYLTAYDDAIRQEMTDIGAVYAAFNGEDKEPERLAAFVLKNLFGGSEDE